MTTRPTTPATGAAILVLAFGLSACTGSDVAQVFADGPVTSEDDFVGQTFPVYYATAETDGTDSTSDAGIGTAEVISADQIRAEIPGQPTRTYTRVGSTNEFDPGDGGFSIFINRVGAFLLADNLDVGGSSGGVLAYQGFETPVDNRPTTAVYNADSFGVLFLAGPDFGGVDTIDCSDCVDLSADFAAGTISGQVFEATTDFDGDTFDIVNTLNNGTIDSTGFSGDIAIAIDVTPSGGGSTVAIDPTLSNQNVIGRFFGENGDQAALVYEGDFTTTIGTETISGTYSGGSDAFAD